MGAIRQSCSYSTPSGGFVSSATTGALASAPLVGSILFAVLSWDKNCGGTITVPAGFTEIGTQHNTGPSVDLALAWKIADGTETTFTSTVPGTVSTCGMVVFELTGLSASGLVDLVSIDYIDDTNVNTRTTATVGPTANARSFAVAIYAIDTAPAGRTDGTPHTWTNGFTEVYSTGVGLGNAGQVGFVMATQSYSTVQASINTTFSYTGTADQAMTAIVVFKDLGPNAVKHALVHPPTTTSAVFKFELTRAATDAFVQVLDYATGLTVIASSTPAALDSELIGGGTVTGLTPNTRYKYRIATTAYGQDTAFTGEFYTAHTAGTSLTYEICFGSDNQVNSSDYTTYPRIAAIAPRFFLSVGDHPYIDEATNNPATFRSKYRTLLQNASWRQLADIAPYTYIYDDHDFGGNDCDSTSASAPAVAAEFRRFYPVPSFPVTGTQAHSFVYGKIRHIVMDLRAERIIGTRIMSATQLQWVKDELTAAQAAQQVVILHSSSPWNCVDVAGQPDTWAPFSVQRTAIMDQIQSLGMQSSVMVHHADAHMLAYDSGLNTKYSTDGSFGLVTICCAAITQSGSTKGGPWSGGTLAGQHQFGRLTITEGVSSTVSIRIRLVKGDDSTFIDQTISLTAPPPNLITFTEHRKSGSTGTGFVHATAGIQDQATKLVADADVDPAAAIALSKLSMGAFGQTLGAATTLVAALQAMKFDSPDVILIKCDFSGGTTGEFGSRISGTGAAITFSVTDTAHPGIATLATGTSGAGIAAVGTAASAQVTGFIIGSGAIWIRDIFRIPTALSDGTNTYFARSGLVKNIVVEPTDAIMFRYSDANSSGHLECVTRAADVETVTDTGIVVNLTDWYHVSAIVNAAGTSVGFYVGLNGATPTLRATHTTNIPVGVNIGPCTSITQTAGTTSRKLDLDFKSALCVMTAQR